MSAGDIKTSLGGIITPAITLASLANSLTAGRASAVVNNAVNKFPAALVTVKFKMGTNPTDGLIVQVFLLRENANGEADDGWDGTNSAFTPKNAPLLGTLVNDGTTGEVLERTFDTAFLGPLGDGWGIAVRNSSGVALDATEADSQIEATPYFSAVEQ